LTIQNRILLVEDEPDLVVMLADRLRAEGYFVETAGGTCKSEPDSARGLRTPASAPGVFATSFRHKECGSPSGAC
jgi:DNA-binding NtrC family response regulator